MSSTAQAKENCPCDDENLCPPEAPSIVGNDEIVTRFVRHDDHIQENGAGEIVATITSFSKDELARKKDKSVSLLRTDITPPGDILRRAMFVNRVDEWKNDPVVLCAKTSDLRSIIDNQQRREACVQADPIDDDLGFCGTHAFVRRADPPLKPDHLLAWSDLRGRIADRFSVICHYSGASIRLPIPSIP